MTIPPAMPYDEQKMTGQKGSATELPASQWKAIAPCGSRLDIARTDDGGWQVTFGGFSRCTSRMLSHAIAEASATRRDAPWVSELADAISAAARGLSRR